MNFTNLKDLPLNERLVFVPGYFSTVHIGHSRLFEFARSFNGKIIIGIKSEHSKNEQALTDQIDQNLFHKHIVDYIIRIDDSVLDILKFLKPAIIIKGIEQIELLDDDEASFVKSYGGAIYFCPGNNLYSEGQNLLESSQKLFQKKSVAEYCNRYSIANNTVELIEKFKDIKVLVIGDIVVDEYLDCEPLGMSQEDVSIAVSPKQSTKFLGGASIVASHLSALGASLTFSSISGNDKVGKWAFKQLKKQNVKLKMFVDKFKKTVRKTRIRANKKTLLRLNRINNSQSSKFITDDFEASLTDTIKDFDLLILCDFGFGTLPQGLVTKVTKIAKINNVLVAADSQTSSLAGDITKFANVDLLTPTEVEARQAYNRRDQTLTVLVDELYENLSAGTILVTLGENGVFIQEKNDAEQNQRSRSDQLIALAEQAVDPAGAGDALLSAASLAMVLKASIWEIAFIGSLASSIQVQRIGNTPITNSELMMAALNKCR